MLLYCLWGREGGNGDRDQRCAPRFLVVSIFSAGVTPSTFFSMVSVPVCGSASSGSVSGKLSVANAVVNRDSTVIRHSSALMILFYMIKRTPFLVIGMLAHRPLEKRRVRKRWTEGV